MCVFTVSLCILCVYLLCVCVCVSVGRARERKRERMIERKRERGRGRERESYCISPCQSHYRLPLRCESRYILLSDGEVLHKSIQTLSGLILETQTNQKQI